MLYAHSTMRPTHRFRSHSHVERKRLMTRNIVAATSVLMLLIVSGAGRAQQMPTPKPGDMGEIIRLDPALDTIIAPGTPIEKVPGFWGTLPGARTEGPVWTRDGL